MLRFSLFLLAAAAFAAEPLTIPLYADRAFPGDEKVEERGKGGVRDRAFSGAVRPDVTVYLPDLGKTTGTAMIIAPGGGYVRLAIDKEGHDIARWLASRGVAVIVLKYRLPLVENPALTTMWRDMRREAAKAREASAVAVEDAQAAMRLVRARAAEWKIKPDAIGMMGFSAGGLLAALMGGEPDAALRPNFLALIYPAVPSAVPMPVTTPVFIAQADDDPLVTPDGLMSYYKALKAAKHPVEMHIYNAGGHGFGMRSTGKTSASWPLHFEDWLAERGLAGR
ncbi:MAG: alpha/beta hydrolase [Bryobacterales bacterium]|nr:alpha/beta hydrolase [Bryobacterales bacterium]